MTAPGRHEWNGCTAGSFPAPARKPGVEDLHRGDSNSALQHCRERINRPVARHAAETRIAADCTLGAAWVFQLQGRFDEAGRILRSTVRRDYNFESRMAAKAMERLPWRQAAARRQDVRRQMRQWRDPWLTHSK